MAKGAKLSDKKTHYIDNEQFLKELLDYLGKCKEAKAAGKAEPPIPNYIGECFLKIATNLSRRPNFVNYSFRDEMIMDGIENCLMYFRNFDPAKSENPFSYFTQIIWFAFIRRIEKEERQSYVKYKMAEQYGIHEHEIQDDMNEEMRQTPQMIYDNMAEYIQDFEEKVEEKRKKRRKAKKQQEDLPDEHNGE